MLLKKAVELKEELIKISQGNPDAIEKIEAFYEHWLTQYSISKKESTKLQSILENIYEGVISINELGIISSFNKAAEDIFGYTTEEVTGKNVKMLMPEPYHSEHDGYLDNYKRTYEKKIIGIGREVVGQKKDGSTFPLFLAVTQIDSEQESIFVGVVRDLSEQKRLEKMKNEFVSTVSHELRTPLTAIQGSLALIKSGVMGELNEKVEPLIQMALNNSERLILLINDILDLEKIQSGKMEFDFEEYDVVSLIDESIKMNQGYADKYNVQLSFASNIEEAKIYVDKNRFHQIMSNLLSNAIKFSPENGVVEVVVSQNEDNVKVEVADKGSGIDDKFKKVIFQKFAQADASNTKQKGGTGLGLNITKAMVENMGGDIGFESEIGKGTTFYLTFPLVVKTPQKITHTMQPKNKGKVLIVEDDPDIAHLISLMLTQENIGFDIAYTADAAKTLLLEDGYDAMTLDIGLLGQDGLSLLDEIRKDAKFQTLPVIVVSANALQEKKSKNLNLAFEVVDWINKPINQTNLIDSLHQVLNTQPNNFPNILHVEDDKDLYSLTKVLLEDIANVELATTKQETMQKLQQKNYDLLLLDIMLSDGSSQKLIPKIKELYPAMPIILFTAQEVDKNLRSQVESSLVKSRTSNVVFLDTIKNILEKKKR